MVASFVLLVLAPAAPVPKGPPPPVEVSAKHYLYPPIPVIGAAGLPELLNIDDGLFIEVTVKNTSREVISIPYTRKVSDRVSVKVTDAKGVEVSNPKRHLGFRRVNEVTKFHELKPGDSLTVIAHLEQNWDDDPRAPGKYTARAVFQSGDVRVESGTTFPLEVKK